MQSGEIPLFPDLTSPEGEPPQPFGPLFSQDGIHPGTEGHRILADTLTTVILDRYGASGTP